MDVKASRAIRQAEGGGASQTMIMRTQERFGVRPQWLAGGLGVVAVALKFGDHLLLARNVLIAFGDVPLSLR